MNGDRKNAVMRMTVIGSLFAILAGGVVVSLTAQQERTIPVGVVDVTKIMKEWDAYQEARQKSTDREKVIQDELRTRDNELETKYKEIQAKGELLSDKQKEDYQEQYKKDVQLMKDFGKQKGKELEAYQKELLTPLLLQIDSVVKQTADEFKLELIVREDAVLYYAKALDITDAVIERLEKETKSTQQK